MGKNLNTIKNAAILIMVACFNHIASANQHSSSGLPHKTVVIKDQGGQSIQSYLPSKKSSPKYGSKKRSIFPVNTPNMSPGKVNEDEANQINYRMSPRPMFIIGYDPVSINWLKANRNFLENKRAIGLVVNVANQQQMQELQDIVGAKIMMQPTSGERLSEHLNIKHYPFYMDQDGVMR